MRGMQRQGRTYLVCLIIHAIFCVESALPATMRPPSYSRPSSSMTTRNSPRANAAMASSMGSNANAVRVGGLGTSWGHAGEAEAGMSRGGNAVGLERREERRCRLVLGSECDWNHGGRWRREDECG